MAQSTARPVVDVSRFRAPDADRVALLAELRSAAHEVGFFYVTWHGVPAALREEVLSEARRFFALPEEQRPEIENALVPTEVLPMALTGAQLMSGTTGGLTASPDRTQVLPYAPAEAAGVGRWCAADGQRIAAAICLSAVPAVHLHAAFGPPGDGRPGIDLIPRDARATPRPLPASAAFSPLPKPKEIT
ncbi:2-oxoglutarate and iron-dependent oxygenase domain-containing protein [Streptomyces sp. NPDC096205]|uniref:2-oxoglutarate and iron-dependent oxygenase domain-containing protein n=1 Tax=Streptomyces sp. NPDC096205 TaxID=3366081 RepID=UPI00382B3D9B